MKYKNISHVLSTIFVSNFGFSEDVAINIYITSLSDEHKLNVMKTELMEAFQDKEISWCNILLNDDYEILEFETEVEAKNYVKKILWDPIISLTK